MSAVTADKVVVELEARVANYQRDIQGATRTAERSFRETTTAADRMDHDVSRSAAHVAAETERQFGAMGRSIGTGIRVASSAAQAALVTLIGVSVRAASAAAETQNAFQVAFGSQTEAAERFAQTYSNQVGRALTSTREKMSQVQLVLQGMGVAGAEALQMTERVTQRAIDLGSLWNVDDAEAFRAILSGITGETEPLKRFGVVMSQDAVDAQLLADGIRGGAAAATAAQVAQARLEIILTRTSSAQDDATRTAGSLTNQARAMQANFQNLTEEFGQRFLPVASRVVTWANDTLGALNSLPSGTQNAAIGMLGLVAAAGPIAQLVAGLGRVIAAANAARVALGAVAAQSGLAGVAAAGGPAVAGVAVVGTELTLGSRILSSAQQDRRLNRVLANPGAASDADLSGSLAWIRDQAAHDVSSRSRAVDAGIRLGPVIEGRQNLQRLLGFVQTQGAAITSAVPTAVTPPVGTGGGAGGRGGGASGPSHQEQAASLTTAAGATRGFVDGAREAEEAITRSVHEAVQGGLEDVDTAAGVTRGFTDGVREAHEAMTRSVHDTIQGGLEAAIHGGWPGLAMYMAERLQQALVENLADTLTEIFVNAMQRARGANDDGGGFGIEDIIRIGASVFSGTSGGGAHVSAAGAHSLGPIHGFASGTDYAPGGWAMVGEQGRELVNLPRGSQVIPNHALRGSGATVLNFDLRGAVVTEDLLRQMESISAKHASAAVEAGASLGHARTISALQRSQRRAIS